MVLLNVIFWFSVFKFIVCFFLFACLLFFIELSYYGAKDYAENPMGDSREISLIIGFVMIVLASGCGFSIYLLMKSGIESMVKLVGN